MTTYKGTVKIGTLTVAVVDGEDLETIANMTLGYGHQYVEEFETSDAKSMTIKIVRSE